MVELPQNMGNGLSRESHAVGGTLHLGYIFYVVF